MKRFWIYWGDDCVSCFQLKNMKQAQSIAKQYNRVKKIEQKSWLTNKTTHAIIYS